MESIMLLTSASNHIQPKISLVQGNANIHSSKLLIIIHIISSNEVFLHKRPFYSLNIDSRIMGVGGDDSWTASVHEGTIILFILLFLLMLLILLQSSCYNLKFIILAFIWKFRKKIWYNEMNDDNNNFLYD